MRQALAGAHCHEQVVTCLTAAGLTQPVETRDCGVPIPFASSHWGSPVSRLGLAYLQGVREVQQSEIWWIHQLGQRSIGKRQLIKPALAKWTVHLQFHAHNIVLDTLPVHSGIVADVAGAATPQRQNGVLLEWRGFEVSLLVAGH